MDSFEIFPNLDTLPDNCDMPASVMDHARAAVDGVVGFAQDVRENSRFSDMSIRQKAAYGFGAATVMTNLAFAGAGCDQNDDATFDDDDTYEDPSDDDTNEDFCDDNPDYCDQDMDGYTPNQGDCEDDDPTINPGAYDIPHDHIDQDCSGGDNLDADGDGYDADFAGGDDCEDEDATIHPGALEQCDGVDEDCDGTVDEDPTDGDIWHPDADGDGFGNPLISELACEQPPTDPSGTEWVEDGTDCDDSMSNTHPGAPEVCDGVDNDCDGTVDDDDGQVSYYVDGDDDGYGGAGPITVNSCGDIPPHAASLGGDCHDGDPTINPGATEVFNGVDDNCNGQVDEGTDGFDDDDDGYTELQGDCDDSNSTVHPNATELPDGLDNDCDGTIDEETALYDDDGDGYAEYQGDCHDGDAAVFPGAPELADGIDNDCDGTVDEGTILFDDDGDGYTEAAGDCDDANAAVSPAAYEMCDFIDNNCNGLFDEDGALDGDILYGDADGDGHGDVAAAFTSCDAAGDGESTVGDDCDDADANNFPGNDEVCDGQDNDCDTVVDPDGSVDGATVCTDADGDGVGDPATVDTSCDGADVGQVEDACYDCDDTEAEVDGSDEDYDGMTDCEEDELGLNPAVYSQLLESLCDEGVWTATVDGYNVSQVGCAISFDIDPAIDLWQSGSINVNGTLAAPIDLSGAVGTGVIVIPEFQITGDTSCADHVRLFLGSSALYYDILYGSGLEGPLYFDWATADMNPAANQAEADFFQIDVAHQCVTAGTTGVEVGGGFYVEVPPTP